VEWREKSRLQAQLPAQALGLETLFLLVLATQAGQPQPTAKEVVWAIARLAGHLNRKADGMPGWKSLWLGMNRLRTLVEGVRLAALINDPENLGKEKPLTARLFLIAGFYAAVISKPFKIATFGRLNSFLSVEKNDPSFHCHPTDRDGRGVFLSKMENESVGPSLGIYSPKRRTDCRNPIPAGMVKG
jgi:hypothetical protein